MAPRLLLVLLLLPAAARSDNCSVLQSKWAKPRGQPPDAELELVWSDAAGGAAAALLRAALLAAGHRPDRVVLTRFNTFCDLIAELNRDKNRSVLAVAVPWRNERCDWNSALSVQGAGAAPLAARLHARLAHGVPDRCNSTDAWSFYDDDDALRECRFTTGSDVSATVYVLEKRWQVELSARLEGSRLFSVSLVSRGELANLVRTGNRSLLFVDASLWGHNTDPQLRIVQEPPCARAADCDPALDRAVSLRAWTATVPWRFRAAADAFRDFWPRPAHLRAVLDLAAGSSLQDAACAWALSGDRDAALAGWRAPAAKLYAHWAKVVGCNDSDPDGYSALVNEIGRSINEYLDGRNLEIDFRWETIDCRRRNWLTASIAGWKFGSAMPYCVGAVAPAEIAEDAAALAAVHELPLLAYTTARGVRSTGGSAAQLAAALRRLLEACRWRRVAALTAPEPAEAALTAAVAALAGPTMRRDLPPDDAGIALELEYLRAQDARIIVLSAGANDTAAVLELASELGLTRANGYVWIVRECDADVAVAAVRPLSLSFAWRGDGGGDGGAGGGGGGGGDGGAASWHDSLTEHVAQWRDKLEKQWQGQAWPRHAAPIVDAMLTFAQGFVRLMDSHPNMYHRMTQTNKSRFFWDGLKEPAISGIVHDLKFDAEGVVHPHVYVEQCGEGSRPRRLAAWRLAGADGRDRCPVPRPPADGYRACVLPYGDPFRQDCLDYLPYVFFALVAATAIVYRFASETIRRKLERHERRAQKKFFERMLSRYPGAYAALESRLVDRSTLERRRALGSGRFGRVWLCMLRGRPPRAVAVKELREGASPAEEGDFMREASTLASLHHAHIVRFVGVCAADGPPLLLMEHAFFGDLRRYLQERRHLIEGATELAGPEELAHVSAEALTRFAREAAEALAHLTERGLVHRDLRAANCLVDSRRSLKLADFGMARAIDAEDGEYACARRALFPVLWMAPETLSRGVSTAASDVWAFGVLALELVTLGARPFGARAPAEVVRGVLRGARAPLPRDASGASRALAAACWRREPALRPAPAALAAWLARRPRALRPALAPLAVDEDDAVDSGFAEPNAAEMYARV